MLLMTGCNAGSYQYKEIDYYRYLEHHPLFADDKKTDVFQSIDNIYYQLDYQ